MVTVNDRKVTWYEDGEPKMTKVANEVKDAVEKSLKEWIKKKNKDPETDSE